VCAIKTGIALARPQAHRRTGGPGKLTAGVMRLIRAVE